MTLSGTAVHEQQDEPPTVLLSPFVEKNLEAFAVRCWRISSSGATSVWNASISPRNPRARRDRYAEPMRRSHKPAPPRALHHGG
jgi:hypothetical protein